MLSDVAKLFDPVGWLAPALIPAKILIQDTWIAGLDWNSKLPEELAQRWVDFRSSLPELCQLSIPRWLSVTDPNSDRIELHGFCDASERAYDAVLYLRVIRSPTDISTHLLLAKSKVAPVRALSIPRLELCGAHLLARLIKQVRYNLRLESIPTFAWSDSQVVLAWIRSHASRWSPFVSHRVASIQETLPAETWHHVKTTDNPADLPTRGITPSQLITASLWWKGPDWLQNNEQLQANLHPDTSPATTLEQRRTTLSHATQTTVPEAEDNSMLLRYSSIQRLLHITALCRRFIHNARYPGARCTGHISAAEKQEALKLWCLESQRQHFTADLMALQAGKPLLANSHLAPLKPFLKDSTMRVGGRLRNAQMDFNEQHPIIINKHCPLARLLVQEAHARTLHGGPQTMKSLLSRQYWIVWAGDLFNAVKRNCITCTRYLASPASQLMGDLPAQRVRPSRPFLATGVDYAAPVMMRTAPGRGHRGIKGYIAVFVCLATKAIHLEAVSDLTSQGFLAAFRRFVARRGHVQSLLSDNGTNFIGADKELRAMFRQAFTFYKITAESLANEGTDWTFIPPHAPHFGGLLEAGVKSTKHHLRRVIGEHTLTYEKMATLLTQIEACLNSRPLYQVSNDSGDWTPLTPGHFLLGEPTTLVPEAGFENFERAPKDRWRLVQQMRDHYWSRWCKEYLHTLQQRSKWRQEQSNLGPGAIVLIKEINMPPAKWSLGRITATHPAADGSVRVVTVRTASSTFKRPVAKLCLLPVADTSDPTISEQK